MKYFVMLLLCFALMSSLPLLWNQFSFIEAGFPFPFLDKMYLETTAGSGLSVSFIILNLVYDLVIFALFVGTFTYIRKYIKN
jgi:hypothetical protein